MARSKRSRSTNRKASAKSSRRKSSTGRSGKAGALGGQRSWLVIVAIVAAMALITALAVLVLGRGSEAVLNNEDVEPTVERDINMPEEPAARNGMYDSPPEMMIDPNVDYVATLKTEKGDIVIDLFADKAPRTVNNFVFLAREGFYDNTTFHRVIDNFMAQAGDPTGTGMGGPGYTFPDEFHPDLRHDSPGTLSMANAGPNTNGSQFFITFTATPWLDGAHAVFGRVIEGFDVLSQISLRDPQRAATPGDQIMTIEITER